MSDAFVTVKVPLRLVDELQTALDYLEERLIGYTPPALESLISTIEGVDTCPIVITGHDGTPLGAPRELTAAEIAEQEASVAEHEAWLKSPDAAAEFERQDRFREWNLEHARETQAEFDLWLSETATRFQNERQAWWRDRNRALRDSLPSPTPPSH